MTVDRRSLLKGLAVGAAASVTAGPVQARQRRAVPEDAIAMLYDATECIGCKVCVRRCREANYLPYEDHDALHDSPLDLSAKTKNIIKLHSEGDESSYMKMQCMHCIDPACAGACMMGSLQKRSWGVVTWQPDLCIGCRYCQVACPFNIPKFQWDEVNPQIVKCEFCSHKLIEGGEPACCEFCPTSAASWGAYDDKLAEAKAKLAEHPDRYEPRVYGEHDGGGTQVLYLLPKGVDFQEVGLPALGVESPAELPRKIQHGVYQGFITPAVLYGVLGFVLWRNRRKGSVDETGHDHTPGGDR